MSKLYLLTFDVPPSSKGLTELHNLIDNDPAITDWMHHIKTTYFIVSTKTAQQLADNFKGVLGNENYIVVQIRRPYGRQGWLNKDAWEWLSKNGEVT